MMNMRVRISSNNIALEIGVPGAEYDSEHFLAFGYDTAVYIERPYAYVEAKYLPWMATYQVGGIGAHSKRVAEDRIAAYSKAVQVGESVVAWLNLRDDDVNDNMKRTYEYLTGPAFLAMAGIEEAK